MRTPSNKIITHLFKNGAIKSPFGLPHFGGKQYIYVNEEGSFGGNIDHEKLARSMINMTDKEIENIMNNKI